MRITQRLSHSYRRRALALGATRVASINLYLFAQERNRDERGFKNQRRRKNFRPVQKIDDPRGFNNENSR